MNAYRLSTLEIKHMVEQALLPHRCTWEAAQGGTLALTLTNPGNPDHAICVTGIKLERMVSSRAISELIGEARLLMSMNQVPVSALDYRQAAAKHW
ncbi:MULTISPECIES: DUF1652 domain-containing protein [Pseudomonas]|uniref:DUF1652 domain-containing protein n=3 Tax=Pseudomonas TaxID=286 RepID=A0ABX6HGN1_9PSED|nr:MULTISPECIES: DUF1652 domain-containing protein [Pseudomonas]MBC3955078.1 DUF1652 domain-containing protein [Pseudomonas triticifolii]QHF04760.1 DUF1652 domain-containing protein [Pseudomonas asturiensis]